MEAALANLALGAAVLLAGVSAVLMVVGLLAYGRTRHARLLWVSLAFALFVVQGIVLARQAYLGRAGSGEAGFPALVVVNLGIVLALYVAVLKR